MDASGVIQSDPHHLIEITTDFFSDLYTETPVIDDILTVREEVWSHVSHMVTERMSAMLDYPLSL